jgi:hypothetical protein
MQFSKLDQPVFDTTRKAEGVKAYEVSSETVFASDSGLCRTVEKLTRRRDQKLADS